MPKKIYIVTHGPKLTGPDPGMTDAGKFMVATLNPHLPDNPPLVCLGEARRHCDVAKALGLWDHPNRMFSSSAFGSAGSLEVVDGEKMLMLPSGEMVPFELTTTSQDMAPTAKAKILTLPENTVICAGREVIIALTGLPVEQASSGALYRILVEDDGTTDCELITLGRPPPH